MKNKREAESLVRGNLALKTLRRLKEEGYEICLVEGGEEDSAFQLALRKLGIPFEQQEEKGMGSSRRQVFKNAFAIEDLEAFMWIDPEKDLSTYIEECAEPVLARRAQIVVVERKKAGLGSLPYFQRKSEIKGNKMFHRLLCTAGLVSAEEECGDYFFGPRVFTACEKYREEIQKILNCRYGFINDRNEAEEATAHSALQFIPICEALHRGLTVIRVPIKFAYPPEQRMLENRFAKGSGGYNAKRNFQRELITTEGDHYLRRLGLLAGTSRLYPLSEEAS